VKSLQGSPSQHDRIEHAWAHQRRSRADNAGRPFA
jgi:hypothetical protein